GRGFALYDADGRLVRDRPTRRRVEALAVPPAYRDVWICALPNGHLQATGRDARGRKQYRYHPAWHALRNASKFDRMVAFGEALPGLRARVEDDLARRGLPREKVLALAVALLDQTLIRIGNEEYAASNGSFGLTTLQDEHAVVRGAEVRFSFVGKSGKEHAISLRDRRLARLVRRCRDIPGQQLFQYETEDGGREGIDSGMVNAYLREATGEDFSAKDFRTWGGTVLAARALAAHDAPGSAREADAAVAACIADVSAALGNTRAVCRRYYVHPDVLGAYRGGTLGQALRRRHAGNTPAGLEPAEAAVLALLRGR
ncbi:MAG: DNA topoisomerase IB, partial [Rubricoccaceae bacterium]